MQAANSSKKNAPLKIMTSSQSEENESFNLNNSLGKLSKVNFPEYKVAKVVFCDLNDKSFSKDVPSVDIISWHYMVLVSVQFLLLSAILTRKRKLI